MPAALRDPSTLGLLSIVVHLMVGQKLGSFRIEGKIGSGAMGVVYRAVHEKTGRPAALKLITNEQAAKSSASDRFEREYEILQQFRHPNIVRFLAWGRSQGVRYLAMEFVSGGTLEELLQQREFLPWREVVDLGVQICEALHYAHQRGVVHRDLKPSNLMLNEDGQIKLTDFGIAKDLDATSLTGTGRTLGTAAYMAPEQIRGTPEVSHKTDLYALGCVLYQMLTGHPPFEGKSAMVLMHSHLTEVPPRPSARNPDMPMALDNLVVGLMSKEVSERPWDAAAAGLVLTELRDKAERGDTVLMVFPDANAPPPRLGGVTETMALPVSVSSTVGRKTTKSKKKKKSEPARSGWFWPSRSQVEVGLLSLAAIAIIAFIVYEVMPPSAEYLFHQVETLMASDRRVDHLRARDEFIDELNRRFPDHKYKPQIDKWLDEIRLEDARRRSKYLISGLSEPKGEAEATFVRVSKATEEDVKNGRDDLAVDRWLTMAEALKGTPDDRKWLLLAQALADERRKVMAERRGTVQTFLDQAHSAELAGQFDEATRIRLDVLDRYRKYPYLMDLLQKASAKLPVIESPAPDVPPTPEPAPAPDAES